MTKIDLVKLYSDKLGKKVLLKKKSSPDFTIVGKLTDIMGDKLIIKGNNDDHHVAFEDILNLDIKGKEEFKERR